MVDSGCSKTTVNDVDLLSNTYKPARPTAIRQADGSSIPVTRMGAMDMNDGFPPLENVHVAPRMAQNLLSVGQMCEQRNHFVLFDEHEVVELKTAPRYEASDVVNRGAQRNGVYFMQTGTGTQACPVLATNITSAKKPLRPILRNWREAMETALPMRDYEKRDSGHRSLVPKEKMDD